MSYPILAFPTQGRTVIDHNSPLGTMQRFIEPQDGMTLRDFFAAKALQGMLTNSIIYDATSRAAQLSIDMDIDKAMSLRAYQLADAMLKERDK